MTIEEQLSWAAESDTKTAREIATNSRELSALRRVIEELKLGQSALAKTVADSLPKSAPSLDLLSLSAFVQARQINRITSKISIELIQLFHRLTCFDLPRRIIGTLRSEEVWIGYRRNPRTIRFQAPPADQVRALVKEACDEWNRTGERQTGEREEFERIARFHSKLLHIHPFADGNGRTARAILMQQCLDRFGNADMSLLNRGSQYVEALRLADSGVLKDLVETIQPIVKG